MKESFFLSVVVAGILCFDTLLPSASAHASGSSGVPVSVDDEPFDQSEAASTLREMKLFANVRISTQDAILLVEKQTGAKVVDISFDGLSDRLTYRIKAHRDQRIWNGIIDASTGTLIGDSTLTPVSSLDARDKWELAGLKSAGINLFDAVTIAEKYAGGNAVSAGLAEADGKLAFLVVVIADGQLKEVSINPAKPK